MQTTSDTNACRRCHGTGKVMAKVDGKEVKLPCPACTKTAGTQLRTK